MIARPLSVPATPAAQPQRRLPGSRRARRAALQRRSVTRRRDNALLARTFASVAGATACVVLYLALMAHLTRMNYDLARVAAQRAELAETSARLDERIARLASRERLARIAAALGMHEQRTLLAVTLPKNPPPEPRGIAFLDWLK